MAEQWTRKYRPTTLDTYVGNSRLKLEVAKQLERDSMPQMLLLHGPAGTGKTTLARLLAKAMVCEARVNGDACGECFNCRQLTDNYILNGETPLGSAVKDYNISNMNSVEDAERIITEMRQIGAWDSKKVYILDEVQEASQRAQAAFLKIAEEPPAGLHIILCTTHPQKLANAFKSRFISRGVQKPTVDELVERLIVICRSEGVNYEVKALQLLVNRIGTVPRECINQAEYMGSLGDITRRVVEESLGVVSFDEYIRFINASAKVDVVELDSIYHDLDSKGIPSNTFVSGMGDFLVTALQAQRFNVRLESEYTPEDLKKIRKVVKKIEPMHIAEAIKLTRNFVGELNEFEYYAYAFSLNSIFNVDSQLSSATVETNYKNITQQVTGAKVTKEGDIQPASIGDLANIFEEEE